VVKCLCVKKAKKITRQERFDIRIMLDLNRSLRWIAKQLNRSPNSISREVSDNATNGWYDPIKADAKAKKKRRETRLKWKKIEDMPSLKRFIIAKLRQHWNPDEISGYMEENRLPFYVSKTAIYDWLYSSWGQRYCKYLYSERYRPRKQKQKKRKSMIPNRIPLQMRPSGANERLQAGHWEGDAIVSSKSGKGGVAVTQERKSRLLAAKVIQNLKPKPYAQKIKRMLNGKIALSLTFDNGIENRNHQDIGIDTYFCAPYSSWQKGGIENGNKMIRRYFPKGTDFSKIKQKQMDKIILIINQKPRRSLGYRSALAVARAEGILVN
jgi:IS30 family transposase